MVEEADVLDGDDGLAHDGGDARQRHLDAVLVVDGGQDGAVRGQDHRALGEFGRIELRRQTLEALDGAAGDEPCGRGEREDHGGRDAPRDQRDEQERDQASQRPQGPQGT